MRASGPLRRIVASTMAGGVLVGATVLGAAPTAAATPEPRDGSGPSTERLCTEALPKVEERVAKALARIQGDAETKGSLAYLQARIDRAEANGNQAFADLLSVRLENRTARVDLLTTAQANLDEWEATYCGSGS